MNKFIITLAFAVSALAPALSFAQSTALTRADVRAELVRVEAAGYMPGNNDNTQYPVNIQAAEAKVAHQENQKVASFTAFDSFGGSTAGTSASGAPAMKSKCVGPASFCMPYFGGS